MKKSSQRKNCHGSLGSTSCRGSRTPVGEGPWTERGPTAWDREVEKDLFERRHFGEIPVLIGMDFSLCLGKDGN